MQSPRALALLLVVLLAACSSPPPVTPLVPFTDGGTDAPDSGASLTIHTSELQTAIISRAYGAFLTASGGSRPYSWHLVEGTLPPGLALSSLGEIYGTPSAHGTFTFHLEVRDSAGHSARRSLTLEVLGFSPIITILGFPDLYLGTGYTLWVTAASGTPPYVWTLASGALPSGLRLNANGSISGTPVAPGPFAFTVRVQDTTGLSTQRDFTLSVIAPPALTTSTLPPGVAGVPYSATLSATGGKAPLTFKLALGTLPPGLRLEDGAVLGTPTTPDTTDFTIEVRDANGRADFASLQLAIRAGLTVTSTALPDAYTGAPYGHGLSAAGGQPPYTWALASGSLPEGLSLPASGAFSGMPSAVGTTSFTVRVTDSEGATDTRQVSLTTYAPPTLAAVPAQSAYVGDNVVLPLSASGGKAPFTFTATSGLPPGLTLDPAGLIHGRPSQAGAFGFDLTARDDNGRAATRAVSFTVHALPTVTTTALPDGTVGAPYNARLSASGGRGTLSWTSGTLPPGLSLASDGTLSGAPTSSGTFVFTVSVTDPGGRTDGRTLSLTVFETPTLTTSTLTDGYVGTPYSFRLAVSGGHTPLSMTLDPGALPPDLALDSSTGLISGTPSAAGTSSFTVRVTDSDGRTSTRALSLTVYRRPSVSGPPLPLEAYVSEPFTARYTATDGKPPYVFSTPDALPSGLALSSTGTLSGTPTATGTSSGQVRVMDVNGSTGSGAFAFHIRALPTITTTVLPEARQGTPYSTGLLASGGKPELSWSVVKDSPPSGLVLSASGTLSGTPTSGTASFTARVTDANGRFAERDFTLSVQTPPPVVTTASLPEAVVGRPYSATLTASGGRAPLTWSHSGALPAGLSLSSGGVVSGTPTAAGTRSFTVSVRDAAGLTDSRGLSLTVSATGTPLTVGHWNIEWFGAENQGPPRSTSDGGTPDDLQIAHARDILGDAGVNVWGLVEMVDSNDFAVLKAQLPGYSGFLANDVSFVPGGDFWYSDGEQKPGILYDSTLTFRGAQLILTGDAVDFGGRPPLRVDFTVRAGGTDASLTIIVLHMKAFEDERSYTQRQRAGAALKSYLDARPSERVLVIGDWNDDLDQSISRGDGGTPLPSPFEPFLLAPQDYTFITLPLSLGGERTTVSFREAIDHTLATNEVAAEYVSNTVRVLRPDLSIPNYGNTVSDHYPVVSRYDIGGPGGGGSASPPHLFINELLPNEPAPDGGTEGDTDFEFIEVLNAGASAADLTGWSLWDSTGERHVFASGTTLAPGQAFVVFGGPRGFPAGTPNTVAASTGQLALNNTGDTSSLRAPDGGTVDAYTWTTTVDNVSFNRSPDTVPDAGFVHHTQLSPGVGASPGRRADGGTF